MCIPIYLWQPLATCFVGFWVAVIAFYQMKVAHDKLRLDLYDRRYRIYDATKKFLAEIVCETTFSNSQLLVFQAATADAVFLFDDDIVRYITEIEHRAIDMRTQHTLSKRAPDPADSSAKADAEHQHFLWLSHQLAAMPLTFTSHLGFKNIRGDFFSDFVNRNH